MQHSSSFKPCDFIGLQLFDGLKASISLGDAAFQMQALGDPDTMPIDALTAYGVGIQHEEQLLLRTKIDLSEKFSCNT